MVSCVVRGLSRSMGGGAGLSYRHMIRLSVVESPPTQRRFLGDVSTRSVDVDAGASKILELK